MTGKKYLVSSTIGYDVPVNVRNARFTVNRNMAGAFCVTYNTLYNHRIYMKRTLHKAWKNILAAGIASLLFGIVGLLWPAIPLLSLIWIFAAYMIVKGLAFIVGSWETRKEDSKWWLLFLYGLLCIVTGIIAAAYPELTTLILGLIISLNFLAAGILQIAMAIHVRKEIKGEGWLILSGIITVEAAIYLLMIPGGGALAMLWFIALVALIVGILFILLALKAKKWSEKMHAA